MRAGNDVSRASPWPRWAVCTLAVLLAATADSPAQERNVDTRPAEAEGSATSRPAEPDPDELLLTGEYEAILESIPPAAERDEPDLENAIIRSRALRGLGRYFDGLSELHVVRERANDDDQWYLARSDLLEDLGMYEAALEAAEKALSLHARNTAARRRVGELLELMGKREKAQEIYAWFDALLRRGYPASAPALVDAAIGIYRHAQLTQRADANLRTRYVLHELLQPAYERVDPRYWPARIAAADLLFSKYNLAEAVEDYRAALEVNPNVVAAHVGLGRIALEGWNFEQVDQHIASALKINPHSPTAHCLRARLRMMERRYGEAAGAAQVALRTNPNHLEGLGLLAAALYRLGRDRDAEVTIDRAEMVNPSSPVVPYTIGSWLAAARRFDQAEGYFEQAIKRDPIWATPQTALGMMYMQSGEERAARRVLDRSWKLDPYNVETKNTLDLLDKLERFSRDLTDHFIIKSDAQQDAAVREYIGYRLEEMYPELCERFGGEPAEPTIIEIFPEHPLFAIRITAKPWLHTVGACTGRVIAIDAPRAGAAGMVFNWSRVLRHEFIHTITLAATNNQIPHWFTEGLAVYGEGRRRSLEWQDSLVSALRRSRLFPLNAIDWGFIRPKKPGDRLLAYAQSEWMVEYIVERWSERMLLDMLEAFAEDRQQDEVFEQVVGLDEQTFFEQFEPWARKQAETWGLSLRPLPSKVELQEQLQTTSEQEEPPLMAAMAEIHLGNGDLDESVKAIEVAIEHDAHLEDPYVLGVLLRIRAAQIPASTDIEEAQKKLDALRELARQLIKLDENHPDANRVLAREALDEEDFDTALPYLQRLKGRVPVDPVACEGLARIWLNRDELDKALDELRLLAEFDDHSTEWPLKIAEIHEEAGREKEAIRWYRETLHIDPYDAEIHATLGKLLMSKDRFAEALREYATLNRLSPGNAEYLCQLAICLDETGQKEEARHHAAQAVALDPECEAARLLEDQPSGAVGFPD